MKLLIENRADVNVQSDWGTALMHYAHGKAELEELLLANGYCMDTSDSKIEGTATTNKRAIDSR